MTANPPLLDLQALYLVDETAWLEESARRIDAGEFDRLDAANLAGFLRDMANRDRREVLSRLTVLVTHLLKWQFQPDKRTGSWAATIDTQRNELADQLDSRTLLNHAADVLPTAYARATRGAAKETGLPAAAFPVACPYTLGEALDPDFLPAAGGEEAAGESTE